MRTTLLVALLSLFLVSTAQAKYNVLFVISDDLTPTALGCYGNKVCRTPNIDQLAKEGTRFTRAYCQGTYCGPSRASFMSGYYPHAIGILGYTSPRPRIGDRETWAQFFKNRGYQSTRVSKIFHMGIPIEVERGGDGEDDPLSWTEKFNSKGPEWRSEGEGETLENNPDGKKPPVGGNNFVYVKSEGGDLAQSDGKTAKKACELIEAYKDKPFFLAVGFVRPHVPFVAPKEYFAAYDFDKMNLPPKKPGDWDDIPKAGINYKTSTNMKMSVVQQKKAVGSYYATVEFMDAQLGKVLAALKKAGLEEKTIVIFTSDHGYHLGEHDFWAKVSLHEESVLVPMIIKVPGKKPAVCNSLVELLDLFPTTVSLCDLEVPKRIQGKDLTPLLDDPSKTVRDAALSVNGRGFLLRTDKWAYLQYKEDGSNGAELFNMKTDPKQYTNLVEKPEHADLVKKLRQQLAAKLVELRTNDLDWKKNPKPKKKAKK